MRVRGERLGEPLQALRVGDGVRGDERHVLERGAGPGDEHELDRDEVLPHDAQAGHRGQRILRGRDAAVDRVLDRDHRGIRPALHDIGERLTDVAHRPPVLVACLGHLRERGFGEGAGRAQVAVGAAFRRFRGVAGHGCQPIRVHNAGSPSSTRPPARGKPRPTRSGPRVIPALCTANDAERDLGSPNRSPSGP